MPPSSNEGRYLLLLDINGTMCNRMKKRLKGDLKHTFKAKNYYVYKRPGLDTFFDFLADQPKLDVYIYTSITQHNAEPLVHKLLPNHEDMTEKLLDRTMNKPDPDGEYSTDTVRDLSKVWSHLTEYGPENTILVDNELRKCEEFSENSIIMPPFLDEELSDRNDSSLADLKNYLSLILYSPTRDVRQFIAEYSFAKYCTESRASEDLNHELGCETCGMYPLCRRCRPDRLEERDCYQPRGSVDDTPSSLEIDSCVWPDEYAERSPILHKVEHENDELTEPEDSVENDSEDNSNQVEEYGNPC